MRSMTTASCTSINSTRPPCRATIGFTWLSNSSATRSYSASSSRPPAAGAAGAPAGLDAMAGWSVASAARIAAPTDLPITCHGAGLRFTTVTRLPDTMTSVTSAPGIAKIASTSGEPFASSAPENRRTPPACTGALTRNLQRAVSIGSAVMRISTRSIWRSMSGGAGGFNPRWASAAVAAPPAPCYAAPPASLPSPAEVRRPVRPPQRQALAQRRLVDLDYPNPGGLEVPHLVPDRERQLLRGLGPGLVVAHERPLEDGHRSGEHPLHRLSGLGLRVRAPAHGHRLGARHVAENDRRLHVPRAVRLHPAVVGEGKAHQLLAEVLDHVVALELPVHQHVKPQLLLQLERARDLICDEAIVRLRRHRSVVQLLARRPHLGRLGERADRGRREERQTQLSLPACGVRRGASQILLTHAGRALLDGGLVDPAGRPPPGDESRVRVQLSGDGPPTIPHRPRQRDHLGELLLRERQPALELRVEPALEIEVDRHMQQRARRCHPQVVRADPLPGTLEQP